MPFTLPFNYNNLFPSFVLLLLFCSVKTSKKKQFFFFFSRTKNHNEFTQFNMLVVHVMYVCQIKIKHKVVQYWLLIPLSDLLLFYWLLVIELFSINLKYNFIFNVSPSIVCCLVSFTLLCHALSERMWNIFCRQHEFDNMWTLCL